MSDAQLSTSELHKRRALCETALAALVDALEQRPDLQQAIRKLMQPDDALETLKEISREDRDVARLVVECGVAALVNSQEVKAIAVELKRRAGLN